MERSWVFRRGAFQESGSQKRQKKRLRLSERPQQIFLAIDEGVPFSWKRPNIQVQMEGVFPRVPNVALLQALARGSYWKHNQVNADPHRIGSLLLGAVIHQEQILQGNIRNEQASVSVHCLSVGEGGRCDQWARVRLAEKSGELQHCTGRYKCWREGEQIWKNIKYAQVVKDREER